MGRVHLPAQFRARTRLQWLGAQTSKSVVRWVSQVLDTVMHVDTHPATLQQHVLWLKHFAQQFARTMLLLLCAHHAVRLHSSIADFAHGSASGACNTTCTS